MDIEAKAKDAINIVADALRRSMLPPPGHITDESGKVIRIIGERRYTKDGALILSDDAMVYVYACNPGFKFTGACEPMSYGLWEANLNDPTLPIGWNAKAPDGEYACYSTPEAAEAAKKGAK